jgi:hypothetical protein
LGRKPENLPKFQTFGDLGLVEKFIGLFALYSVHFLTEALVSQFHKIGALNIVLINLVRQIHFTTLRVLDHHIILEGPKGFFCQPLEHVRLLRRLEEVLFSREYSIKVKAHKSLPSQDGILVIFSSGFLSDVEMVCQNQVGPFDKYSDFLSSSDLAEDCVDLNFFHSFFLPCFDPEGKELTLSLISVESVCLSLRIFVPKMGYVITHNRLETFPF